MKDSVSIAFELMLLELDTEEENLNEAGVECFRNSNYESARDFTERGMALKAFREKIEALSGDWEKDFSENFPKIVVPDAVETATRKILSSSKSSKSKLLVRFPDGKVIFEDKAADTFAQAIKIFGFDKVSDLGLVVNKEPLVSRYRSKKYNDTEIDGFFIKTHSSTAAKKRQLEDIASKLGAGMTVSIVGH